MALGSPMGWWHLASSCCCWLCPGALLTVPGTSVICNWFSRAARHKQAHTHVGVCPNIRVDSHAHGDLSMRPSSHACAPQPRLRTNLTRAWQHFARWHAILLLSPTWLHVCTRRRSPKCAHTRRCARTDVPVSPWPRARRASPCPRSALCSPEPALPSCAQILEQLLAAAGASRPRRPLAWGPECHVSPRRSEPPRPPQAPRRLLHGARWEPPSASSLQAVHGEGALRGGPQLQLCC